MISRSAFVRRVWVRGLRIGDQYFRKLVRNTILITLLTVAIYYTYLWATGHEPVEVVPTGLHSMIGFVIALLLVFRTNTAYDRWWEGRQRLAQLHSTSIQLVALASDNPDRLATVRKVKSLLMEVKTALQIYNLTEDNIRGYRTRFRILFQDAVYSCKDSETRKLVLKLSDVIADCEMIKTTPIPFAYAMHIKVCLLAYILSLPFSTFHALGLWSALVVAFLYFLIAGIEIIANEIEDPFAGEPNDLPLDELFGEIFSILDAIPAPKRERA